MSHLRKQMLNAVREHAQAHIDKHRMNVYQCVLVHVL